MPFSVIIPSRNAENLKSCAEAIVRNEPALEPGTIIVVDDGARDSAAARGFRFPDGIEFAPGVKPFVYARNINIGIRAAGTNDVILLNDDALLRTGGGFSDLARVAAAHPEFGVISAACNNVGNTNQWPQGEGLRVEPRMVCFVAAYIPRRTIEAVGLLDEEFTGYGYEDDSYCLRARRAGLKIGVFDGCFVDHKTLKSTFRGEQYPAAGFAHNAEVFRRKYGASNHEL